MAISTIALVITGIFGWRGGKGGRGPALSRSSPPKDEGALKNG